MRRPLVIGAIVGGIAFIILVVVGAILVGEVVDRQNALAEHDAAVAELQTAASQVEAAVAEVDEIHELASDPLIPADQLASIMRSRDAMSLELDEATDLLALDADDFDTPALRELNTDLRGATTGFAGEDTNLFGELRAVALTLQTAAAAVEAANFEAENQPHIAFRLAVEDLTSNLADGVIAENIATYLHMAHGLEASHAEEIAEKAGPLFDRRMAVEEFARSISGGVLLDFDWAPVVNNYGRGGSYGGTTYWGTYEGGYATITLSDSVASMWPGAGVQSLVAHEVGHAILSKCTDLLYDSEFYVDEEESWATAWAIGLGYTADGSGESIYGRPPDGLIALSQQCR